MTKVWRHSVGVGVATTLLVSVPAFAHTGHSPIVTGSSFGLGFIHPFSGLDHILMMLAVGFLASQYGSDHRWKMPAWFIIVLATAGITGAGQTLFAATEIIVALSIIAGGIMLFVGRFAHSAPIYGAFTLFGGIHGFVHGVEKPVAAATETYVLGVSIAAASLIVGGLIAASCVKANQNRLRHALSAVMMGVGLFLTLS